MEFFTDLFEPGGVVLQRALLAGMIASIACGVIGSFVVARRITYIAGGIAHCTLGGMGVAYYLAQAAGLSWLDPMYGAVASALIAAVLIGWVSLKAKQREDTIISAVWSIGMAIGFLFIAKTEGYNKDLMSYLFGSLVLVSIEDIVLIIILDVVVLALAFAFYSKFMAVCFDEEFSRIRGVKVPFYYLLLLCLTALTVVVLIRVVGLILVIALLTLPVAIACRFCWRLWQIMLVSSVLSMFLTAGGLAISYSPELPAGATIIALTGAVYMVSLIIPKPKRGSAPQPVPVKAG